MSAHIERLVEELRSAEAALAEYERIGHEAGAAHLRTVVTDLQRRLNASNQALTEVKQILKG